MNFNNDWFKMFSSKGGLDYDTLVEQFLLQTEISILSRLRTQLDTMIAKLRADGSMDPFAILGLKFDATEDEVKKAYRKKAYETHPDMQGGSDEAFVKTQAAYETIFKLRGWT